MVFKALQSVDDFLVGRVRGCQVPGFWNWKNNKQNNEEKICGMKKGDFFRLFDEGLKSDYLYKIENMSADILTIKHNG